MEAKTTGAAVGGSVRYVLSTSASVFSQIAVRPKIWVCDAFFDSTECEHLIAQGAPLLTPARVYADSTGATTTSSARTAHEAFLTGSHRDSVVRRLEARVAAAIGASAEHLFPTQILRYEANELHVAHLDALDSAKLDERLWADGGQRVATCVVYLSEVQGGDTIFPRASVRIHPTRGRALYFHNVDEYGSTDPSSLHGSTPVEHGTKWAAVYFVHERRIAK